MMHLLTALWLASQGLLPSVGAQKDGCLFSPSTVQASSEDSITLVFTGDLLLDRGVRRVIEQRGEDAVFSHSIDSLFGEARHVVANLECPVTHIQSPVFKRFVFRGEPAWLPALRRHGITHLNLANNHSIDQGRKGLLDTRQQIEQAGMTPFGADSTLQRAARPLLLDTVPRRIYVLPTLRMALENYAYLPEQPSVSMESIDTLLQRISSLRQTDPQCYIIVCPHWGAEHRLQPTIDQRIAAHRMVDAGADCIIGHHTHTLQTIEAYRGKPIYYSIGNFIFDPLKPINSRAALVKLTITATTARVETLPIVIRNCQPQLAK